MMRSVPFKAYALVAATCVLASLAFNTCEAMTASPAPFTAIQNDGQQISLYIRGNEYRNYLTDTNGYIVVQNSDNTTDSSPMIASSTLSGNNDSSSIIVTSVPRYTYATFGTDGSIVSSGLAVGSVDTAGAALASSSATLPDQTLVRLVSEPGASFGLTPLGVSSEHRRRSARNIRERRSATTATRGSIKNLVLMIRFADCRYQTRTATTPGLPTVQDLDVIFNGATNSVKDVFKVNSYGAIDVTSLFSDWITVSSTVAQASGGSAGLEFGGVLSSAITQALALADAKLNFKLFDSNNDNAIDMITILHSDYAAEWGGPNYKNQIWSHKSYLASAWTSAEGVVVQQYHISPALWGTDGTEIGRIGVIAHESGHFFGLNDMYDRDGPGYGSGLGSYSLMANSWGFDGSQNYPPIMDAWNRIRMGWIPSATEISQSGTYVANAVAYTPQVFKISQGFPAGEYLLIENRQAVSYDADMPQGGLCIYHVDEMADIDTQGWPGQAGWPSNGNHYKVALLQADGLFQLESTPDRGDEGDVWRADGKNVLLGPKTVPNTNSYQLGKIKDTGITISINSPSENRMSFTVSFANTQAASPTCTDGIQNQGEQGVDCGGPCSRPCAGLPSTFATATPTATPTPTPTASAPTAAVASIILSQVKVTPSKSTSPYRATAAVRVINTATRKAIGGAKVVGAFYRTSVTPTFKQTVIGTTNVNNTAATLGLARVKSSATWATKDITLWFCVTGITVNGYTYDQTANSVTCISVSGTRSKVLVF